MVIHPRHRLPGCRLDPDLPNRALLVGVVAIGTGIALSGCGGRGSGVDRNWPVVGGYEQMRAAGVAEKRMLGEPRGEILLGEVLIGELGCLSCHASSSDIAAAPTGGALSGIAARIRTKKAPDLSTIGQRVTPGWLAQYLRDPQAAKPGATMPSLLHAFALEERDELADQLTNFLIDQSRTLDPAEPTGLAEFTPFRFRATVERGRELFHTIGCVACHAPEARSDVSEASAGSELAIPSIPLPDLASKTSVAALSSFLRDPASVRPSGRMPSFYLSEEEATDLAVYLLREQEPDKVERVAGLEFEYFLDEEQDEDAEGFWDRPPPVFDRQTPVGVGHIDRLSLDLPIRTHWGNHAFRFGGLLPIERAGSYTFELTSDQRSGSELLVGGAAIATKPPESGRAVSVEIELEAGDHAVEVTYYIRGDTRTPFVEVNVSGGAIDTPQPLDRAVVYEAVRMSPRSSDAFVVDAAMAEQGRRAFAEVGCASCHALASAPSDVAARYPAPPLDSVAATTSGSAAAWHTRQGSRRYNLASHQRAAISAALADLEALAAPRDPAGEAAHSLAILNCYACHNRVDAYGGVGGPEPARRQHFRVIDNQDVGDEGRLPPTLTQIGDKLKLAALESVLREEGMHVRRSYMEARMPRFSRSSEANGRDGDGEPDVAAELASVLTAADSVEGDLTALRFSRPAVFDGLKLVGSEGLRCITCHDVGSNKAPGISMVNLATVYDRLRPGWVDRLLRDPGAVNTRTRMPPFWTDGSVIHPDIAGGTVEGQINAIWSYMSLGSSMPVPSGMNIGNSLVLVPENEPIVFRTFMTDASPRAIVVGFPESVHVAFDANVMRLTKAWRGGFYDAKGTWSGRAGQFFDAYGEERINMPPGPAFARLATPDADWPQVTRTDRDVGGEWLGYELDGERRPIFHYRLHNTEIDEQAIPVVTPGGANLTRRFTLRAGRSSERLFLLVAEGDEIEGLEDLVEGPSPGRNAWRVDGSLDVSLSSNASLTPIVRSSQGVWQVLVPINLAPNQTLSVDVALAW